MATNKLLALIAEELEKAKNAARGGDAFSAVSGLRPEDLAEAGKTAAINTDPRLTNAPSHSAVTERIARRLGSGNAANLIGLIQELPSALPFSVCRYFCVRS